MQNFKKLNRDEMKGISGGAPMCTTGQIVQCVNGCAVVTASQNGQTANAICVQDGSTAKSILCYSSCPG